VDLTKVYQARTFGRSTKLISLSAWRDLRPPRPNGAGKTTTVGVFTTRVIPTSGKAFVGGIRRRGATRQSRSRSGGRQSENTLDRSCQLENLYFTGGSSTWEPEVASGGQTDYSSSSALNFARASVYALSGGMAQRLMVARAIFHARGLFLDEPTAGLDPQGRLHSGGFCVSSMARTDHPLTTHYMEEADQSAGASRSMDHGKDPWPSTRRRS